LKLTDLASLSLGQQTFEAPKREYKPVARGMRALQFTRMEVVEETAFEDRSKRVTKLRLFATVVDPKDPDYGNSILLSVTPKVTAPNPARGEKGQQSKLYEIIKEVLYNGDELPEAELQKFWSNPTELERLLFVNFNGLVKIKTTSTGNQRNVIDSYDSSSAQDFPPYERPAYQPDERNNDPETLADPEIRCAVSGETIYGWGKPDGTFFSQREWVEYQNNKTMGTEYEGKNYGPTAWRDVKRAIETGSPF
jgi:hypothetical protein